MPYTVVHSTMQTVSKGKPRTALQEMVPVPSTSPVRKLQPPTVWCATICGSVQYLGSAPNKS